MRVLVIGTGSIGQRHIRNLTDMGIDVSAVDTSPHRLKEVSGKYGIKTYASLNDAFSGRPDAALICAPTRLHVPIATEAARHGIHLFIEKPLSDSMEQLDSLVDLINKNHLISMVGCNIRFSEMFLLARDLIAGGKIGGVLSVRAQCGYYLPYWHPEEDYRKGYSANRSLGGGVILDDIHELDFLRWMFGDVAELFCMADKVSSLETNTEDVAEILLRFKNGLMAQIHLDYIQRTYRRSCEFIGEEGMVIWDYIHQRVELCQKASRRWEVFESGINVDVNRMFVSEMVHFLECVRKGEPAMNDIFFAGETLRTALACRQSSEKKEAIRLVG